MRKALAYSVFGSLGFYSVVAVPAQQQVTAMPIPLWCSPTYVDSGTPCGVVGAESNLLVILKG